MSEQSTRSLIIAAPADRVMAVIADFEAYPEWTDGLRSAQVQRRDEAGRGTLVEFRLDAGMLSDTYLLDYTWDASGLAVQWQLVHSRIQRAQQGSYTLRETADETEVTYRLSVELAIPLLGPLRRKAEQVIMSTALEGLQRRVLALS